MPGVDCGSQEWRKHYCHVPLRKNLKIQVWGGKEPEGEKRKATGSSAGGEAEQRKSQGCSGQRAFHAQKYSNAQFKTVFPHCPLSRPPSSQGPLQIHKIGHPPHATQSPKGHASWALVVLLEVRGSLSPFVSG